MYPCICEICGNEFDDGDPEEGCCAECESAAWTDDGGGNHPDEPDEAEERGDAGDGLEADVP